MAPELLFGGTSPWCSASAPAASSVAVLGAMQQLQQPCGSLSSLPGACEPSEWRDFWSVEESSPSSSTLGGSPVESLAGCNGAGSDEDECDLIAGLAEQIAHSMLDDDDRSEEDLNSAAWTSEQIQAPAWNVQIGSSASPQSSLAGLEWCRPKRYTSVVVDSSKVPSKTAPRTSSPKSTVSSNEENPWELLYAAAGEVAKLTRSEERKPVASTRLSSRVVRGSGSCVAAAQHRRHLPTSMKQLVVSSVSVPSDGTLKELCLPTRNMDALGSGSPCNQEKNNLALLSNLQRSSRARARDEERGGNAGQQYRPPKSGISSSPGCRGGGRHRVLAPSSGGRHRGGVGFAQRVPLGAKDLLSPHHFPPLGQQHPYLGANGCGSTVGSGMRAVFLGSAGSRESGGTGVFLPRRVGCGPDLKKKPVCSTVLLPSRIVEALNLNMEGVIAGPASPPLGTVSLKGPSLPTASLRSSGESCAYNANPGYARREEWSENQWTTARSACSPLQEAAAEINLPTEWTY